jgi:hypothetical protein
MTSHLSNSEIARWVKKIGKEILSSTIKKFVRSIHLVNFTDRQQTNRKNSLATESTDLFVNIYFLKWNIKTNVYFTVSQDSENLNVTKRKKLVWLRKKHCTTIFIDCKRLNWYILVRELTLNGTFEFVI